MTTGCELVTAVGIETGRSPISSAVRTAELIGLRPVAMPQVTGGSQPVASEIRRDS